MKIKCPEVPLMVLFDFLVLTWSISHLEFFNDWQKLKDLKLNDCCLEGFEG